MLALANTLAASGALQNPIARGLAELRKFGADAHLYLPGPGIPILGPELVTNGDFGDGANGWAPVEATLTVVNGEAVLQSIGPVYGRAIQSFAVVSGKKYCISVAHRNGTTNEGWLLAGSASGAYDYWLSSILVGNSNATFVAKSNTLHLTIQNDNLIANAISYHDNVSVREILGYTNTISGITAGNYFDSIGTTHASVDGLVGAVLDAVGSVGPELVNGQTWATGSANTSISGGNITVFSGAASGAVGSAAFSVTPGKTYRTTFTISGLTAGRIGVDVGGASTYININNNGTFTQHIVCAGGAAIYAVSKHAVTSASVQIISVKEITGIHATQATTGNKPTLRRGLVNLLTWSNDLTNGVWVIGGSASKVDSSHINFTASTSDKVTQATANGVSSVGEIWTQAVMLSGSGQVSLFIYDNGGAFPGTSSSQITLTATPTMYVVSRTHTDATTTSIACQIVNSSGTAATVTVGGSALLRGTLTAAQILAAGGIPLTTTAPASSSVGAYSLEFKAANSQSLALGSVPFQLSDDHCVVQALNVADAAAYRAAIFPSFANATNYSAAVIVEQTSGKIYAEWKGGGNVDSIFSPASVIGTPIVFSARKVGTTKSARLNGNPLGTRAAVVSSTTAVSATIGSGNGLPFNGTQGGSVVIKGTVSDAQLLIFERMINALSGYSAGRF